MVHNTDKENWINEVLGSTQGMKRAAPGADLFEKITARLANPSSVRATPLPIKQWAAAAILLLALNIGSVVYFTSQKKTTDSSKNPFAAAMQEESTYNY
jgi:hypothetical protein